MKSGLLFRYIIYMILAVWALYIFKIIDLRQAYSMTVGVVVGALIGFIISRMIIKKK